MISAKAEGLPEPLETGTTFVETPVSRRMRRHRQPAFPRWGGRFGHRDRRSRWCARRLHGGLGGKNAGMAAISKLAMRRAWDEDRPVRWRPPFLARFRATLILAWPDGHDEVSGKGGRSDCNGPNARASGAWPIDPIFQPKGFDITFGEWNRWEKNRRSHRADAFDKFVAGLGR